MQIAIIDLGTNTFNLMVAETQGTSYTLEELLDVNSLLKEE